MSLTAKETRSLRKIDLQEQKSQYTGFKRLMFAHKATAGDAGLDLSALVAPSEMVTNGFSNPTASQILGANLQLFKNNLVLTSSLRGLLMLDLSYTIRNNRINFIGFTALDGEIFTGTFEYSRLGTIPMVDARALTASGTLAANSTDFAVGEGFALYANPLKQIGDVVVYRNGIQQFRCEGNVLTGAGNYIEVGSGGTASLIRFKNTSANDDSIMVCSVAALAERPQESMLQYIESISGKLDSMIPTVAELAGVSESTFGGVTNVDLKTFGDTVNKLNKNFDIDQTLTSYIGATQTKWQKKVLVTYSIQNAGANVLLTEVTFYNLTVGRTYKVTLYADMHCTNNNNYSDANTMRVLNNGTFVVQANTSRYVNSAYGHQASIGATGVFVAAATTLEVRHVTSGGTSVNYLYSGSFVILEELPQHVQVTDWT